MKLGNRQPEIELRWTDGLEHFVSKTIRTYLIGFTHSYICDGVISIGTYFGAKIHPRVHIFEEE